MADMRITCANRFRKLLQREDRALLFKGYDAKWDDRSKLRMNFLAKHSSETIVVCTDNCPPSVCYRKRDRYLVDQADCLLAVYDNDRTVRAPVRAYIKCRLEQAAGRKISKKGR